MVDQVLSSASNMLAVFAIAGVSTVREFGSISLAIAGVMAIVSLCRGLLGTPIALLSGQPAALRIETDHALALAGGIGVAAAVVIGGLAPVASDPTAVLAVAAAAPAILMQDSARFACIAAGRPGVAVASDGLWAGGSVSLFVVAVWINPDLSPLAVVSGWAALAVLACVVIQVATGHRARLRGLAAWLRSTAAARLRYGATSAISAGNGILFLFVVALLIGSSAVAALRGSASVLGPLSILLTSMLLVAVPEMRLMRGDSAAEYWRPMRKAASLLCMIPVTVGLLSFWVPDAWGEALLGPTWFVAHPLLPITAAEYVALTWGYSADAILTARADSRAVLAVQVVHAAMVTIGATVAAITVGTARGVAVGLAIGAAISAVYGVRRTLRNSTCQRLHRATLG